VVEKGVSSGSGIKPNGEEDGLEFFIRIGEFEWSMAGFYASVAQSAVGTVL
jgi:hypothetical protein